MVAPTKVSTPGSAANKPPQIPRPGKWCSPELAAVLLPMREAMLRISGQVGTGVGADTPVKQQDLEALVNSIMGQTPQLDPILQPAVTLSADSGPGMVRFLIDPDSINYKGHSSTEVWRSLPGATVVDAEYVGPATGTAYNDFSGVVGTEYSYFFRNVNILGDVGDWMSEDGLDVLIPAVDWDNISGPEKPQSNADVTLDNTSRDTLAVAGVLASEIAAGAYAGANISNWNTYYVLPGTVMWAYQVKLDVAAKKFYFRAISQEVPASTMDYVIEIEVMGTTVTAYTNISMETAAANKGAPIDFSLDDDTVDLNFYGPNGIRFGEGVANSSVDEFSLTLALLDPSVSFRMRIWSSVATLDNDKQIVTLGDRVIKTTPDTPTQVVFAAVDGSDLDALLLLNGPAEAGAEQTTSKGTSILVDDAGFAITADWSALVNKPSSYADLGIYDIEPTLGSPLTDVDLTNYPNDNYVLASTASGVRSWVQLFGPYLGFASIDLDDTDSGANTTFTDWGTQTVTVENPGAGPVQVVAILHGTTVQTTGNTVEEQIGTKVLISLNGASSFTSGNTVLTEPQLSGGRVGVTCSFNRFNVATGQIVVKAQFKRNTSHGAGNKASVRDGRLLVFILPNNLGSTGGSGTMTATIATTKTATCTRSSAGSCTASANISATITNGTPAYTYSGSKVSGSGSVTASTSNPFTVSFSQTAAEGAGNSSSGTYKTVATDSASHNATSNNCVVTFVAKIVYPDLVATVPSTRSGVCSTSGLTPSACTCAVTITATGTGGKTPYSYSHAKVSGSGSLTGSTGQTATASFSDTTNNPPNTDTGTYKCTITDSQGTPDTDASGNCVVTFNFKWIDTH